VRVVGFQLEDSTRSTRAPHKNKINFGVVGGFGLRGLCHKKRRFISFSSLCATIIVRDDGKLKATLDRLLLYNYFVAEIGIPCYIQGILFIYITYYYHYYLYYCNYCCVWVRSIDRSQAAGLV
jgi:hypothetical protein